MLLPVSSILPHFIHSFGTFYSFVPFLDAPECRNFSVLSDPGRYYCKGRNSDIFLKKGWYRFQSRLYTRMLDSCKAGRGYWRFWKGWLNGTLPLIENGIVEREVCFKTRNWCCYERLQIRVRKCAEEFYVYELSPAPYRGRSSSYCAKE